MKLSNPIEESGFFWIPEDPERKFPGILKISESGETTLEITSLSKIQVALSYPKTGKRLFGDPFSATSTPFERIVGRSKRGYVTLEGCRVIGRSTRLSRAVIASILISARRAFIGVDYGKGSSITFSTFRFSVEGLDEWLSITGSQPEHVFEGDNLTINFSPPEKIKICLPEQEMALEFDFNLSIHAGFNIAETKITQKAHISLKSSELRPLDDFLTVAYRITHFLCFVIGKTVSITSATGYSNEKGYEIPIEIFFRQNAMSEESLKIDRNEMLLSYGYIQNELQDMIVNWLKSYQKFERAFNLYFVYKAGIHRDSESEFLSLVQSLEAMHRRESQEKLMPDDEFESIRKDVLRIIPERRRSWMEDRMRYANELSLRKRLTKMIEPFRKFYGSRSESDSFINAVVDVRNQIVHPDPELPKSSSDTKKTIVLCAKLQSLLQLHLLGIIGMDGKNIEKIIEENVVLRSNLKLSENDIFHLY